MGHLTSDELVDLAEGSRDRASMPHLAVCDACRQQLADLRAMISIGSAGDLSDIPEPSPLFWDHLSARVSDAVRSEEPPARESWLGRWLVSTAGPRVAVAIVSCAVVVAIAAALGSRVMAPGRRTAVAPPPPPRPVEIVRNVQEGAPAVLGSPDDPSLSLVADYGRTLDWDELREQMAVSSQTGMDAGVVDLNGEERQELQRLLREALARPGAAPDRS